MLELIPTLSRWVAANKGRPIAAATVIAARGSVPRPVGTSMFVSGQGDNQPHSILGSISGGCVEGAVVASALEVIANDSPRTESFGYDSDDAFAVGLTCGGELDIYIQPLTHSEIAQILPAREVHLAIVRRLEPAAKRRAKPVVIESSLAFDELEDGLRPLFPADVSLATRAATIIQPILKRGGTAMVTVPLAERPGGKKNGADSVQLLVESRLPVPRLIVVGANDFGAALIPAAQLLGYHVTLVEARRAFAVQDRFATADKIACAWPHEYLQAEAAAKRLDSSTVLCVLSHDPKFDVPLLRTALKLDLAYVGAMGSRRSHQQRVAALVGTTDSPLELERLHSPIGLDLSASTPAEIAISILAEIMTSTRPLATGSSLRELTGPIH
ncbi:XdhC family protein [Paenarthrobacter sp. NPDC089675]|uniref:XdhC family protein n=1 Tax=Paenarthrobacter sp. NPDC089675 TaxID=3364376 RepID=UPI0037F654D7